MCNLLAVSLAVWSCMAMCSSDNVPVLTPQRLQEVDVQIVSFLDKPSNSVEWESIVTNMEHIVNELKLYMRLMRENNEDMVQRSFEIYQTGKPKFVYHSMSEPEIRDAVQVTNEQLERFHILRDKIDNVWDEFVDVVGERTGEIMEYVRPPGMEGLPGFRGYRDNDGYGGGRRGGYRGEEDYGRGWGRQGGGGGRGRGRGRRRGGGYDSDFGPPYR